MAGLTITRPMQQPLYPGGVALWLTKRNRGSVRPLCSRIIRWRIGWRWYAANLLAPAVVVAVAHVRVRLWIAVGLGILAKFGPDTLAPTRRIDPRTAELAATRPTATV